MRVFHQRAHSLTDWAREIPEDQWRIYSQVIDSLMERRVPFAIGGAFAVATITGFWRDTKDLDIYALPEHRDGARQALDDLEFQDYFDTKPYDRWWIYRGVKNDTLVDLIWAMANHRAQIDDLWMSGPTVEIRGRHLRVLPAEALLWDKLYIMQRERCDWPDAMNILYWACEDIDWEYLLERVGDDRPLLAAAITVFRWLSPGRAQKLPPQIWDCLGLSTGIPPRGPQLIQQRADLLDRRPWYGPDRARAGRAA